MKRIIEIPEYDYQYALDYANGKTSTLALNNTDRIIKAVANSTPLNKCEVDYRNCVTCIHSNNGHCAGTEECHGCMWENQYTPTTKNDLALLEKTYADFCNCEGGEGWLKIDGKEYATDAGYALEGMSIFMEVFKRRLAELPSVTPQEPFINKPCVSEKACEHDKQKVLDKIRAEIEDCLQSLDEIEKSGFNIYLPNEISGRRLTYQQCLEFIDKYKAETEA